MKKITILLLLVTCSYAFSQQKIDTIKVDSKKLLMMNLQNGTINYLVYRQDSKGKISNTDIWMRSVAVKNDLIHINQKWENQNREIYSINKLLNFESVYHYAKNGKGVIEAFDYKSDKIVGSDSIASNKRKGFEQKLMEKSFNWELDLEFFQLLPYKLDKTFVVNFYHPGSKTKPRYYNYKVIGKEKIIGLNGNKIKCWLLKIDYAKNSSATFYISVKTKEVIKMIETYGEIKRYKLKLI